MTTTTHAPGPDGEPQLAAGLTADQAQAHEVHEPEPVVREPGEPEPEPGERREKIPALVIPDLRPYADPKAAFSLARRGVAAGRKPAAWLGVRALAGIATLVRSCWKGNRILAGLLTGWLTGAYGEKFSIPVRLGGVVALFLALVHTVQQFGAFALVVVVQLWFLAAAITGLGFFDRKLGKAKKEQPEPTEKTPEASAPTGRRKGLAQWLRRPSEQAPADTPIEAVDQTPAEAPVEASAEPPLTALIRELIGDDNGVHLGVLRPAMRVRLPGLAEADDMQLRKVLVQAGFDPSRTFRARGIAGRAGVHRSQLPPLPSPEGPQKDSPGHSPPPESGPDLRKSPRVKSVPKSDRRPPRRLPEGWTEEDDARGYRVKNDPDRGPAAWVIERREDVE
ncbi:hypothetical protein [Streptomyces hokutonensis]|uniref:hypothetical protein n=1 Tax=Streptomyces hokutonensis TaxID=1306990 RepID=UPI003694F7FD